MADIPSPLTWGTVRGNFGALNADSSDTGLIPDLDPVQGTVTLTPRLPLIKILNPLNPMIAIAKTVVCTITNGVLVGPDGSPDVRVVATDSPGFEPSPLQWDVRIQITGATVQPAPMIIDVPGGKVVDLALIVPSPPAVAVVTVITEESKLAAQAAAVTAVSSAQAALGSSIDASNSLQDTLTARIAAIDAKNAAQAASATAVSAKDTAVSSSTSATSSKNSAATSATAAATSAAAAEVSAVRAEDAASSTLPLNGTTAQYLRGDSTWATLNKAAAGLSNVDNTSDASKPISAATQAALVAQPASNITSGTLNVARLPSATTAATGVARLATSAESIAGALATTSIAPSTLRDAYENWHKSSTRKNAVIVGSSNAVPGTWAEGVCTALGLTMRNFSAGGAAYHAGGFLAQVTAAKNDASFSNNDVGFVFITDCSNDTRAKIDTVYVNSGPVLAEARSAFPNARIIVIPIIWPADPSLQWANVPGGYQTSWNEWVHFNADALRRRCMEYSCEFVEDSWTWLTGHNEWMESSGGVHPNTAGYTEVTRWVLKYLRGEETTAHTAWTPIVANNPAYIETINTGSARPIKVRRDGWKVVMDGAIIAKVAIATAYTDWLAIPPGFRPTYSSEIRIRVNNSLTPYPAQVFPDGTIRVYFPSVIPEGSYILASGTWEVG